MLPRDTGRETRISSDISSANGQYCNNSAGPATLGAGGVYVDGLRAPTVYVPGTTLTNVNNTISGSGLIGQGDGNLTFINQGTVDATPLQAGDTGLIVIHTKNTGGPSGIK